MTSVAFEGVDKVYPDGTLAVESFDLDVRPGEFMVFVGPSGCGKTTALRMVAGLEAITAGTIRIGDNIVNDVEPRHRDIAMVFQNYALYPHMSVYDNIAFGLKMRHVERAEIRQRVNQMAQTLGLTGLLSRRPAALSGGQRQRVARGRAIVRAPQVFLMDEPLSNLDAKLRVQMRAEISRIQRELSATTIYVTHDQVEAMTMGDRVAVMRRGRLQQCGPPRELYQHPANLFVASFIGSPAMNLLHGTIIRDGETLRCKIGSSALTLGQYDDARLRALVAYVGRDVAVGIRPENLASAISTASPSGRAITGRVVATELLGPELLVHVEVDAKPVLTAEVLDVASDVDAVLASDAEAALSSHRTTVIGRFGPQAVISVGETLAVAVDVGSLHFFDLDTEVAISTARWPISLPVASRSSQVGHLASAVRPSSVSLTKAHMSWPST
jgi:multiple sugar transport system ATP-binding protein